MAAKAIFAIENQLEPKCEGCGSGASRPKCAFDYGGGCPRHQQENVIAYNDVISMLVREGDLRNVGSWRYEMPAYLVHGVPSRNSLLLLEDLVDRGGKWTSKADHSENYEWFRRRAIVSVSFCAGRNEIEISKRGREYINDLERNGHWPVRVVANG